ncbi:hypothetical protein [Rhodospirillum sp. A1_3_36]|uniref:hypothetical protein n=1 Tax=Rhodospirillum sp. A1_3_36 TaxID=3391666 RepID=UPI0039A5204D
MTRQVTTRQFSVSRSVEAARKPVRHLRRHKAKRSSHVLRDVGVIVAFCGVFAAIALTLEDRSGDAWKDTIRSFSTTQQSTSSEPVVRFGK